jgi:hypothetical protein
LSCKVVDGYSILFLQFVKVKDRLLHGFPKAKTCHAACARAAGTGEERSFEGTGMKSPKKMRDTLKSATRRDEDKLK